MLNAKSYHQQLHKNPTKENSMKYKFSLFTLKIMKNTINSKTSYVTYVLVILQMYRLVDCMFTITTTLLLTINLYLHTHYYLLSEDSNSE